MRTPWGQSDHAQQYAPGIVFYGTPSHGGFHLDRKRHATVKRIFPAFETYAGGPWYEEDEDWRVVVIAFPECFPPTEVCQAVDAIVSASNWEDNPPAWASASQREPRWTPILWWLRTTTPGMAVLTIAAEVAA